MPGKRFSDWMNENGYSRLMRDKDTINALDYGHIKLIENLRTLLAKAENFEFHDFKNKTYAAPKGALHNFLMEMIENVRNGSYDN